MKINNFTLLPLTENLYITECDDEFPSTLRSWNNSDIILEDGNTHYGYVYKGNVTLQCKIGNFSLSEGMYFSIPGKGHISGAGQGTLVSRIAVKGLFSIGGPVEEYGRLKYIDGCSDSLLMQPVLKGYPCLNFLHIPPGVNQTPHTHPSVRVGLIISGAGICITPDGDFDLLPGKIFVLKSDFLHSFHTKNNKLRLVIYHPDSDFGPTNEDHPMLNRTIIGGISASHKRKQEGII